MNTNEISEAVAEYVAQLNEISPVHSGVRYATYTLETAPRAKYSRVVMNTGGSHGGSVHAFIELATGKVMKPAGWKGPVKGKDGKVRPAYDLTIPESRSAIIRDADWAGGYLYHGRQSYRLPQA